MPRSPGAWPARLPSAGNRPQRRSGRYRAELAHRATERRARRRTPTAASAAAGAGARTGLGEAEARAAKDGAVEMAVGMGLPKMMARVLIALWLSANGRLAAAELTRELGVSPASVSAAVGYLTAQRLIRREAQGRRDVMVDADAWYTRSSPARTDGAGAGREGVAEQLGPTRRGGPAGQGRGVPGADQPDLWSRRSGGAACSTSPKAEQPAARPEPARLRDPRRRRAACRRCRPRSRPGQAAQAGVSTGPPCVAVVTELLRWRRGVYVAESGASGRDQFCVPMTCARRWGRCWPGNVAPLSGGEQKRLASACWN